MGDEANGNGEGEEKPDTIKFDPRFPNQNQTRHCYQSFVDYHRCIKMRGEEYEDCQYYAKAYKVLCPSFWISKWEEQLQNGTFPSRLE